MDGTDVFRFRQFAVKHTNSTMKVGTDAVLLGAWSRVDHDSDVLEIGTGCGVIALMISQKTTGSRIVAVDIDKNSVMEAAYNFSRSPWSTSLQAVHASIQDFAGQTNHTFDHIISNPPFFSGDKHSVFPSRTKARHTVYLDHWDFLNTCDQLLNRSGMISVVLPVLIAIEFIQKAAILRMDLTRLLKVRPKPNLPHNRYLLEFSKAKGKYSEEELLIYEEDGAYTNAFRQLTKDYYIDL